MCSSNSRYERAQMWALVYGYAKIVWHTRGVIELSLRVAALSARLSLRADFEGERGRPRG
jgi:hypothetical protein